MGYGPQVDCEELPNGSPNKCKTKDTFSWKKSKTFTKTNYDFDVSYADEEGSAGIWGSDSVKLGNGTVEEFKFGVANTSSAFIGILGLGFSQSNSTGDSLTIQLKDQMLTNRSAYSVFLNENETTPGNILFGAVDHSKYYYELQTIPMVPFVGNDEYKRIRVNVSGIDINFGDDVLSNVAQGAYVFDTGSTVSTFPSQVLDLITQQLNIPYNETISAFEYEEDCHNINNISLSVNFEGKNIQVPSTALQYIEGPEGKCLLQMMFTKKDDDVLVLGIDVLRSIYFVVDLGDEEVSLAQAKYTNNRDIEVFPPPEVNRTLASRGRSQEEEKVSRGSLVSSIDVLRFLMALYWIL